MTRSGCRKTSTTTSAAPGVFDLGQTYTVSFCVVAASGSGNPVAARSTVPMSIAGLLPTPRSEARFMACDHEVREVHHAAGRRTIARCARQVQR